MAYFIRRLLPCKWSCVDVLLVHTDEVCKKTLRFSVNSALCIIFRHWSSFN